jgi:hypothetical protein
MPGCSSLRKKSIPDSLHVPSDQKLSRYTHDPTYT